MPHTTGTLEKLAGIVGQAVQPLEIQFARDNVVAYFVQLGALFPDSLGTDADVGPALDAAATAAGRVADAVDELVTAQQGGDALPIITAGVHILDNFKALLDDIDAVASAINAKPTAWAPLTATDIQRFTADF